MSRLVRKQVYITEEQEQLLKQAARRERRTEAEILRAALDRAFGPQKPRPRSVRDPIWEIVGVARSEPGGDVARNVDHYLYGVSRR